MPLPRSLPTDWFFAQLSLALWSASCGRRLLLTPVTSVIPGRRFRVSDGIPNMLLTQEEA